MTINLLGFTGFGLLVAASGSLIMAEVKC